MNLRAAAVAALSIACASVSVASATSLDAMRTVIGGPTPVPLHCRVGSFCIIVLPPGEHITGKHLEDTVHYELDDDSIGSGASLSAVLLVKVKSEDQDAGETDALVTTDGPVGIFHVHLVRDSRAPLTAALRFLNAATPPPETAYDAIKRIRAEQERAQRDAAAAQAAQDAQRAAADAAAARFASHLPCKAVVDYAYKRADVQDPQALFAPTHVWNDGKHTCVMIPSGAYDLPIIMVGGPGNSEETVNYRFDSATRMYVIDGTPSKVILIDGSGKGGRRVVVQHK